ncbi:MAG: thioredoxin family protein [Vampirovibrionales bacterium]|nr:thioredoxin family protein [Vampirovibrionales bacterium]
MFKRSTVFVLSIVAMVFVSSFAANMIATAGLPSSYDPGVTIDDAFKSAKTPLLVEFYSDSCSTCKHVSPILHELSQQDYRNKVMLVMMDVEDPAHFEVAKLFGVNELPSVYVFDFHRMKKQQIRPEAFPTKKTMQNAIDKALTVNSQAPLRNPMAIMQQRRQKVLETRQHASKSG